MMYAYTENFVLPLSHDEVVHGKGSLLEKMAGDDWQRRANLRLLFGYQYTIPGKKLLFMGDEFAQRAEWDHEASLDWHLLDTPEHQGMARWVQRLNVLYRDHRSLHVDERSGEGFSWLSADDAEHSVLTYRRALDGDEVLVCANFTPVPRQGYEVPVEGDGDWVILANSDALRFGGSGYPVDEVLSATATDVGHVLSTALPPLALLVLGRRP